MLVAAPPPRRHVLEVYPHTLNTNTVSITLDAMGEVPEFVAVSVRQEEQFAEEYKRAIENFRAAIKTNRNTRGAPPIPKMTVLDNPQWLPFRTNLLIDLGPGEGKRKILFAYKYKGQAHDGSWRGSSIIIQGGTPSLCIVSPTSFLSSQPMIQLQGLTSRKFKTLRFDQFDNEGKKVASGDQGLGTSFAGGYDFKESDQYFSFLDVDLSPGTNNFLFYGTDEFGNEMSTNLVIVFSTAFDRTPPLIDLDWPKPNAELAGADYTIRGRMDDFTARLKARIRTRDGLTTREALVERSGYFWIEHVPLVLDANQINLTATDSAGNSSETNLTITGCEGPIITMAPVNPPDLWKQFIAVTGQVTPPNHDIWINGVQANVESDGTWSSGRVPVLSPNGGGTAVFEISAVPRNGTPAKKSRASGIVSAQASLSTNAIILNASTPACGVFRLRLTESEDKSFVILASTNLIEWIPILTNTHAGPSFDYTLGTTDNACRFFKIAPLP
jgi:hypothetical protein